MSIFHAGYPHQRRFQADVPDPQRVQVNRQHSTIETQPFRPLPAPTGQAPYHLALEDVLPAQYVQEITSAGRMVFHVVGDTGGVKRPEDQQLVASHMEEDFKASDPLERPAFFYHLGDVIYYYGEEQEYYSQFYEPYSHYAAPIFAIPGNHDGDVSSGATVPSLQAFVNNFCASEPHLAPSSGDAPRDTMTQPNVYWTLTTPLATFIGLYTNVPEGGKLDDEQIAWFQEELKQAPQDKALIVATHHPIYSSDNHHSGSQYLEGILEQAMNGTGRVPNLVLNGHVHNYQRYTRMRNGQSIAYIVAGGGGYWNLHYMVDAIRKPTKPIEFPYPIPGHDDLALDAYNDDRHGYLKMAVTASEITGEYYTVPRSQDSWTAPATLVDQFSIKFLSENLSAEHEPR